MYEVCYNGPSSYFYCRIRPEGLRDAERDLTAIAKFLVVDGIPRCNQDVHLAVLLFLL